MNTRPAAGGHHHWSVLLDQVARRPQDGGDGFGAVGGEGKGRGGDSGGNDLDGNLMYLMVLRIVIVVDV